MSKTRGYTFTINNYTCDDIDQYIDEATSDSTQYSICGFEVGDKGTPHMQCYIYYKNAIHFDSFKKRFPRAHILSSRGTPQQNYEYCSKDGDYMETGELPHKGRATWDKIQEVYENPKDNPHLFNQYRKTYEEIKQRDIREQKKTTHFYVIDPVHDAITEIFDYFDWSDKDSIAVVDSLDKLEAYPNYDHVIYFTLPDLSHQLWARGMPITYKYGYQTKVIKPDTLVIVTSNLKAYKYYKRISSNG